MTASATILFGTGDPTYNTTVSVTDPAYVPWQYEGRWGGFLGTPIAANHFITAAHVGGTVGQAFDFQGQSYTTVGFSDLAGTDLRMWQVDQNFPSYAPIYRGSDEVGKGLVVIGRGTQRGSEVLVNGQAQGWYWGTGDGVQRWGENTVASAGIIPGYGQLLSATFDAGQGVNEAHLSSGDSGGAVFILDESTWKLAGINYAVNGPYSLTPGGTSFIAAMYDQTGLYAAGSGNPLSGPGSFYATRISSYQNWIDITAVPEPATIIAGALLLLPFGASAIQFLRQSRTA